MTKANYTRWNSFLFQYRSILRLSAVDLQKIRSSMPHRTVKQQNARNNFGLKFEEREKLQELVDVLELFEFVTDEFQADGVTISK